MTDNQPGEKPDNETVNRESHPNASGPDGLAGEMGISSEREGPFEGIEGTGSLASAADSTDGESPTDRGPHGDAEERRGARQARRDAAASRTSTAPSASSSPTRWPTSTSSTPRRTRATETLTPVERFTVVPAAYVFLLRPGGDGGREVLLQLRQGTGYMDDHWAAAVAGHVEKGETVYDAARREADEEVGISDVELVPWCAMQRTGDTGRSDRRAGRLLLRRIRHGPAPQ